MKCMGTWKLKAKANASNKEVHQAGTESMEKTIHVASNDLTSFNRLLEDKSRKWNVAIFRYQGSQNSVTVASAIKTKTAKTARALPQFYFTAANKWEWSRNRRQPVILLIHIFAHTWSLCCAQILVDGVNPQESYFQ